MSSADNSENKDKPGKTGEEPLAKSEMGDKDSGGLAGQGGMRDQDKTSDDGKFRPS